MCLLHPHFHGHAIPDPITYCYGHADSHGYISAADTRSYIDTYTIALSNTHAYYRSHSHTNFHTYRHADSYLHSCVVSSTVGSSRWNPYYNRTG